MLQSSAAGLLQTLRGRLRCVFHKVHYGKGGGSLKGVKELIELSLPNLFPHLSIVFTAVIGITKVVSPWQSLQHLSLNHFHSLHCHLFKAPRGTKIHISSVFQLWSVSRVRRRTPGQWEKVHPWGAPLALLLRAVQCGEGRRCLSKVGDDTPSHVSFLPSNPLLSAHACRANCFRGSQSLTFFFPLCLRTEGLLKWESVCTQRLVHGDSVIKGNLKQNTTSLISYWHEKSKHRPKYPIFDRGCLSWVFLHERQLHLRLEFWVIITYFKMCIIPGF